MKHELDEQRRRIVAIEQGLIQAGQLPASTLLGAPISVIVTAGAGLWWVARPDARAGALLLVVISWGLTAILYLRARARIRDRINTAEKQRRQQLERFESGAASFLRSVHAFERAAVEPLTGLFSPTVGPHRALPGRDIRLRVDDPRTGDFELDSNVLPAELGILVDSTPSATNAQIFRVVSSNAGRWVASKSACYFDTEQVAATTEHSRKPEVGKRDVPGPLRDAVPECARAMNTAGA